MLCLVRLSLGVAIGSAVLLGAPDERSTPAVEFFETKVRPLLASKCYSCHTEARSGGLRMDEQESILRGGKDGPVLVPGKPEQSMLIKAVRYTERIKMPPTGK